MEFYLYFILNIGIGKINLTPLNHYHLSENNFAKIAPVPTTEYRVDA